MNIEFYNKKTGEVIDPTPEYELYVVDNEGDVLCISFNNFGDVLGDFVVKSSIGWRVLEIDINTGEEFTFGPDELRKILLKKKIMRTTNA